MPDVIKQARFTLSLLDQDQIWIDGQGNRHDVTEMSLRYKENVVPFLERRASVLEFHYTLGEAVWLGSVDTGEMAFASLEREMDAEHAKRVADPLAWLRTTALVRRLNHDISNGIGGEDD